MPVVRRLGFGRSRSRDFSVLVCGALGVVLLWSRLANLGTSFWSDEAFSAQNYSGRGPHAIFFTKWVPNNHVLFNLLSWATTKALGQTESVYRLWSVLPGLAAIALIAYWLWKRVGAIASTMLVALAAVSPTHLDLTTQARGYGLAMFAGAAMLVAASRASDRSSGRDVALFAASALVGIFTLPVFAIAAGGQALVLLADKSLRRATLIACGVITVASLVFYAPMLGDIAHNAHQQFGSRLPIYGFITGPYHHLVRPTIGAGMPFGLNSSLTGGASLAMTAFLFAAAAVRLIGRGRRDRALLAHIVMPVLITYVVFVGARFYVQPRFASYLLFHALVLLAIGVQQIWDLCARVTAVRFVAAVLIVVFAGIGVQRVEIVVRDQQRVPWENSRFVADVADSSTIHYVYTDSRKPGALQYYLGTDRVIVLSEASLKRNGYCHIASHFIFVDDSYHRPGRPDVSCLLQRKAIRLVVPQQLHPPIRDPGRAVMYIVPALPSAPKAKRKAPALKSLS